MSKRRPGVVIATLLGFVALPAVPAAARPIECDDGTYYVITHHHQERDVLERFRSENNSKSETRFKWAVTKVESREYRVGGVAGGEAGVIFGKVKAEVNGDITRKYESSTEHSLEGTIAPRSVAVGAYSFAMQHFSGYANDCVGGRSRAHRPFSGSAPFGYVFQRDS
jgi:hypothetical protein